MSCIEIAIEGPFTGKASLCEPILRALPEWFGIEQANRQYVRDIQVLPTFLAVVDGDVAGFLTLKQHNPYAAEIHIVGVRPDVHRLGIGRALLVEAENALRRQGVEYLQVKTLSESHPDENYARTRAFYVAMGFGPLEEFKAL